MIEHARVHVFTAARERGCLTATRASEIGDPGGATRDGISQRLLDRLGPEERARLGAPDFADDVTPEVAARIGCDLFWRRPRVCELWPISPALALATYDAGFQSGPGTAITFLQRALDGTLRIDGAIGDKTLSAARATANPLLVALDCIEQRRRFLSRWALRDSRRASMLDGLHRRCDEAVRACVEIEFECRGWDPRAVLRAPFRPQSVEG